MTSKDIWSYLVRLGGPVAEAEINANSPVEIAVVEKDAEWTQLAVFTDQSGLIGLLRHIHSRGLTLLSVTQEIEKTGEFHV